MTIYSIRDSLGQELYWTTSRKGALTVAAGFATEAFRLTGYVSFRVNGKTITLTALEHQLPVAVYKSSVIKPTE